MESLLMDAFLAVVNVEKLEAIKRLMECTEHFEKSTP
jgi:hypothetical protein